MIPLMKRFALFAIAAVLILLSAAETRAAKRPNVVWILSEDNSIHYLRLYGNELAPTPNIEKLAASGLVYDNAFSCAPVCSVARTTLAMGIYAPRGGFQYHRKSAVAGLPQGFKVWTQLLQEAGYYTSNNSKTDYNIDVDIKQVWNDSSRKASWRNRPDKGKPFFHMQTFGTTHESSLHFKDAEMRREQLTTPKDKVQLAPYHPDTPLFRHTYARYHDKMKRVDEQIGELVSQLEKDGLLDDTFIFYFGDHGGVLPRGKGYAYESGLHVPLVVRIPANFKEWADFSRGDRVKGFVSFVDFGPTVLELAGVKVPELMDGRPFLGKAVSRKEVNQRDTAFGHADRFDEKYDLVRTLRVGRFMYHRNYQGYYPDGLQNNYRYKMLAYEEWRQLWNAGKLNGAQRQFFERRPAEQLFDIETDPHQVKDLAADPKHRQLLLDLRTRLTAQVKEINDLSFYPESHMVQHALGDPIAFGRKHSKGIARLVDIADLALQPFGKARGRLNAAINSKNEWERYWALTTCAVIGEPAKSLADAARKGLKDDNLMVRLRAAEFLGLIKAEDPRPTLYGILNETVSSDEALLAFNGAVLFNDFEPKYPFDLGQVKLKARKGEVTRRTDYFSGNLK